MAQNSDETNTDRGAEVIDRILRRGDRAAALGADDTHGTGEFDGDLLIGCGSSPDGDGALTLEHHVVGEDCRAGARRGAGLRAQPAHDRGRGPRPRTARVRGDVERPHDHLDRAAGNGAGDGIGGHVRPPPARAGRRRGDRLGDRRSLRQAPDHGERRVARPRWRRAGPPTGPGPTSGRP